MVSPFSLSFFLFCFLGAHSGHMEVPRLGVELELQLSAYTTQQQLEIPAVSATYTTAHSNAGSFNPLSEARDPTYVFMDPSQVHQLLSHEGNSFFLVIIFSFYCNVIREYFLYYFYFLEFIKVLLFNIWPICMVIFQGIQFEMY